MTPKEKAYQLVKALSDRVDYGDIYWNGTSDAKDYAKLSIDIISDGSEFWQQVKTEIDLLPTYIEDYETTQKTETSAKKD